MTSINDWVNALNLEPHVEGGYFRQVYRSEDQVGDRKLYTSIYFLLTADNPSHFHRLTADEIWYYHVGQALTIHMIRPGGVYEAVTLGTDVASGQQLQFCVPKGIIFGSTVEEGFALVSCMVAPGFEYEDFELFDQDNLLADYPQHGEIIKRLTRPRED